jgi:hypothetical protein
MCCPALHRLLLGVAALAVAALFAIAADDKKDDEGFKPLFNGKDFTGWKFQLEAKAKDAKPEDTWSVKDGMIICTGKPNGYFYTEKSFKNYVIRYDWRYKKPDDLKDEEKFLGNSGLLVHITGEHKVWPKCLEVQGMNRDHAKLIAVSGAKLDGAKFDNETLKKVRKPVGEWNTTEASIQDGSVTAKVNGTEISSGKTDLTEGQIGFQSEGAEIHFRNIKIKELK